MASSCPRSEDLKAFALGAISHGQFERIASHVSGCTECDAALRELDTCADELVSELKLLVREAGSDSDSVPEPLVQAARRALHPNEGSDSMEASLDPGRRLARKLLEGRCRLGRFELEAELGIGTFGYVFRARDTELDRTVAIKIQRAGSLASDEEVERFLREARSASRLKHPGIVAIHDTGRTEDDVYYLVTEYVDGASLETVLAREKLSYRETARIVAEIADALAIAHDHGVIHRDVKPSNILLDAERHPHVTDFGLAKRETGDTMTSDGRVMGTPAYMSPEQARGQSHQVDARSDIYSVGVILYEMLTGERPFQGNPRMLLLQLLENEPRPPHQLDAGIPRDLETICLKAMAKAPSRRYRSAAEVADDLRRFLRGEPILARPMGYAERLGRWCRRYPIAATLLVAVPIGSAAGFSYLSRLSTQLVRETALDSTRMQADMLEKINTYYSEAVVGRLDWKAITVTHEYMTTPQSLPLPFTFMIDALERITGSVSGMRARIYSEHPWRENGGPKDDFERRAIQELRKQLEKEPDNRSYYEFTQSDGRPVLQYARAQIMQESCVKCHNEDDQSPKTDWQKGDLAGVLAITRPLERDIERTQLGLRSAFNIMGGFAVGLTAMSLSFWWAARRRTQSTVEVFRSPRR